MRGMIRVPHKPPMKGGSQWHDAQSSGSHSEEFVKEDMDDEHLDGDALDAHLIGVWIL